MTAMGHILLPVSFWPSSGAKKLVLIISVSPGRFKPLAHDLLVLMDVHVPSLSLPAYTTAITINTRFYFLGYNRNCLLDIITYSFRH